MFATAYSTPGSQRVGLQRQRNLLAYGFISCEVCAAMRRVRYNLGPGRHSWSDAAVRFVADGECLGKSLGVLQTGVSPDDISSRRRARDGPRLPRPNHVALAV